MKKRALLGAIIIPEMKSSPYLAQLYEKLEERMNIWELKEFTFQYWYLIYRRKRAQIFHIHWIERLYRHRFGPFYLTNFIAPFLLKICKHALHYTIVVTLHNIEPHESTFLDRPLFKLILSMSDKIIVHNNFSVQKTLQTYGKDLLTKIVIVPHGNFVSYFTNDISKREARKKLGIKDSAFVFLFFGYLRPYKGLENLIDAFRKTFQGKQETILMIVGRPPFKWYADVIRSKTRKLSNCVLRCEFVPDDDVQLYLNAADVGVLAHEEITTPATLFLFISFRKPVIASNLPPNREICSREFCIFFKPNSMESLANAMKKAYDNKGEVQKMGVNAFKKAQLFDWDSISRKTLDLYVSSLQR